MLITRRSALAAIGAASVAGALPARAAGQPLLLRASLDTAPGHARNTFIAQYLKMVEEQSNGAIKTKLFQSGQLFADKDVAKALLQGQIEMAAPLSFLLSSIVPDASALELPITYGRSAEEVQKLVDGPAGQHLSEEFVKRLRVRVVGSWLPDGFQDWFSVHKPLNTYQDFKGMKIRVAGGILQFKRVSFLGGIPVSISWPDVPLAMSQGVFDALSTVDDSAVSVKLWDSGLRYGFEDHQELVQYVPIISDRFWQKLSPEQQKMLKDIWAQHIGAWRAKTLEDAEAATRTLSQHGVKIVRPSAAMVSDLRKAMLPKQDAWAHEAHISPKMVKIVNDAFKGAA